LARPAANAYFSGPRRLADDVDHEIAQERSVEFHEVDRLAAAQYDLALLNGEGDLRPEQGGTLV
jgi:hypothetical protein